MFGWYSLPSVRVRHLHASWTWVLVVTWATILVVQRRSHLFSVFRLNRGATGALAVFAVLVALSLLQWLLSWIERPFDVTKDEARELDQLFVTVNVPVYNEDPHILDRVLYSLFYQTRIPNRIEVVDDGSRVDYSELRDFWVELSHRPGRPELIWKRQRNRGKRMAQAATFRWDERADIFVTVDSDSTLEAHAIEEALKPFVDPEVQSVKGLEMPWNYVENGFTMLSGVRSLTFQLVGTAAQNVAGGDVLVNPGAFSLYRADLIRRFLRAYVNERFLGRYITLGDDAALTLFAQVTGRAVQQPTASAFSVYPQTLSHVLRQWIRWMRGSTIRTCWRLRYLPIGSFAWWYTLVNVWMFFFAMAMLVAIPLSWPTSAPFVIEGLLATAIWPMLMAARTLTVARSDIHLAKRIGLWMLTPFASLWMLLVLRPLRAYGIVTCRKQGWKTRTQVEKLTAS
jgi:hyaluronan synthase